jgi:hypothetical protein
LLIEKNIIANREKKKQRVTQFKPKETRHMNLFIEETEQNERRMKTYFVTDIFFNDCVIK